MTTDTSIRSYASIINNSEKKNVLTKKQVKTIEKIVKSNLHKCTSTLSLTTSNKSIEPLIKKMKSGKSEIDKQLKQGLFNLALSMSASRPPGINIAFEQLL